MNITAADAKLIERVRNNLADYQAAGPDPITHARFAGVFSVNLDEMLELVERLTRPAAVQPFDLPAALAKVYSPTGTGWPHA
jgi:hypothetical protein